MSVYWGRHALRHVAADGRGCPAGAVVVRTARRGREAGSAGANVRGGGLAQDGAPVHSRPAIRGQGLTPICRTLADKAAQLPFLRSIINGTVARYDACWFCFL